MSEDRTYVAAKVKRGLVHYFPASQYADTWRSWVAPWCRPPGWDYDKRDLTTVDGEATCKKCQEELIARSTPPVRITPKAKP